VNTHRVAVSSIAWLDDVANFTTRHPHQEWETLPSAVARMSGGTAKESTQWLRARYFLLRRVGFCLETLLLPLVLGLCCGNLLGLDSGEWNFFQKISDEAHKLLVVADVNVDISRRSVKMALLVDAVGDNATVPENHCRIAHCAVPTPATLIPGRLLVNPLLYCSSIVLFGALAERRPDGPQDFRLRHSDRDAICRLCRGLAGAAQQRDNENEWGGVHLWCNVI
jgi:hypothetical protein